jgi:IrrE N-terminal-like domain
LSSIDKQTHSCIPYNYEGVSMKIIRNLFFIGACLTTIDSLSFDRKLVLTHLARFIPKTVLAKAITGMGLISGYHISTDKTIWDGSIGQHRVLVVHNNAPLAIDHFYQQYFGFNFNEVSYQKAAELWKRHQPSFEKVLPRLLDTKPIEIRMCSRRWGTAHRQEVAWYFIWVDLDIVSETLEESAFCLAHEIAHILLHHPPQTARTYKQSQKIEKETDLLAAKILNSADGGIKFFTRLANPKNPLSKLKIALRDKLYGATYHPLFPERIKYLQHWKRQRQRGKS